MKNERCPGDARLELRGAGSGAASAANRFKPPGPRGSVSCAGLRINQCLGRPCHNSPSSCAGRGAVQIL